MKTLKTTTLALAVILTTLLASCTKESVNPVKTKTSDTTWTVKSLSFVDADTISFTSISYNKNGGVTSVNGTTSNNQMYFIDGNGDGYMGSSFSIPFTWNSDSVTCPTAVSNPNYQSFVFNTDSTIKSATSFLGSKSYFTYTNENLNGIKIDNNQYTYSNGSFYLGNNVWMTVNTQSSINPLSAIRPELWLAIDQCSQYSNTTLQDQQVLIALLNKNLVTSFASYTCSYKTDVHGNLAKVVLSNNSSGRITTININWQISTIN